MRNALVVFTETHFLASKTHHDPATKMQIKDGFCDPEDTRNHFVSKPMVLQKPVRDIRSRCNDIGVEMMGPPHLLQHLLAELCGLPTIQYCIHLVVWMKHHESKLDFALQWYNAHGFDLEHYYDHLGCGGPADGLEVLLVSLAIDTHINIVMDDIVWSTGTEGPNFKYPTVVFTNAGALPCKVCDSEDGNLGDVDTTCTSDSLETEVEHVPVSLTSQKSGGRPLIVLQEISDNCDTTESNTDPEELLTVDHTETTETEKHWEGFSATLYAVSCGPPFKEGTGISLEECSSSIQTIQVLGLHECLQ